MSKLDTIAKAWRKQGLRGLYGIVYYKTTGKRLPARLNTPLADYKKYHKLLKGKKGLEIGGPSDIFEIYGQVPVYHVVGGLDGCNFSTKTIWEGNLQEGQGYQYNKKSSTGYQYIAEASELSAIPDGKYDFVLSSHSIEHIANPLKAVRNWLRVLKKNGVLLMVVPHKEGTFDHRRPVTPFSHLLEDFKNDVGEDDLTHLPEILELHDLGMDPWAGDFESFRQRSLRNRENRCLHHHVFNTPLVIQLFDYFNLQIEAVDTLQSLHIVVIGRKTKSKVDNTPFMRSVHQTSSSTSDQQ